MLTHLQIRDFAIIDLVDLEVRAGLTVLTGETGAGKSIIVDALALLAGGKGGAEVVRAGAERAEGDLGAPRLHMPNVSAQEPPSAGVELPSFCRSRGGRR